ncbi:MAG TPA: molybdopterin-dependent oxidoreductase [Gammaproteobacteria bacterium]|nr:molybdopterin-dependent oxidoreductase [Gammaproteobacteria bacterium]
MKNSKPQAWKPSVCPLDCPDTCSLQVGVDDGKIVRVRGSRVNPYTAGAVCDKVAKYYPDFVHGESRLRTPMRRVGKAGEGRFEAIDWETALQSIAERTRQVVDEYGPEAVLPFNYAGPHGQLAVGSMDRRFFHRLGASLLDRGPLCGGVRGAAYESLFGNAPGMAPEQAADADLVAVWGNNVTVSNLHLARIIKQARERGGRLIVVDPKRTRIADQAQLYLQIAPGTDVVLALAAAAEIERRDAVDRDFVERWVSGYDAFMNQARQYSLAQAAEICRVPLTDIEALIDLYCGAGRLALSIGNGIERGKSGGSGLRAIMSLSALLGQFGRRGAGVIAKPGFAFPTTPEALQRTDLVPSGTRRLNIVDVGRHLLTDDLEPPIRAAFIYNHNPVATHPDQNRMIRALGREEIFKVGIDVVMTDSMRYCDIVLPAASHFEFDDLYTAYGHSYLQRAEPVIPPVGEALPNTEIFRRLAKAMGFSDAIFEQSDRELMDQAVDRRDPRLQGFRPSEIPLDRALAMGAGGEAENIMCDTVMPATPSGRIELYSEMLETRFGYGVPRYQAVERSRAFTLITPSSSKRTNATFGAHQASAGPEQVEINPQDAAAAQIADGELLELVNDLGRVRLRARLSDAVAPGVLYSPKGTWLGTSDSGRTVNALIDADLRTDIFDGACYNETFVDLNPLVER